MIKLKLKRKVSGKAIKKAKRKQELSKCKKNSYFHNKRIYWKNSPLGRRSETALYDLENKTAWENNYGNHNPYVFKRLLARCKNDNQRQRLYKVFPYFHPDAVRKREHEEKVRLWQQKLKANEHIQNQNRTNSKKQRLGS